MEKTLIFFHFLLLFGQSAGHLCLIFPEQRGDMNIQQGGSKTCARHEAECGGQPPEMPGVTPYIGGQQMWIKFQQNYNHYEVGFPGYMDIAIVPINSTDYQTLAFTTDYYVYAQDHQQNFTFIVVLPNIDCAHCVIRARYNPHKPGETTFYQCADIKVQKSDERTQQMLTALPPLSQDFDPQYRNIRKKFNILRYENRNGPQIENHYLAGLSYNVFKKSIINMVNISIATGYPFPVQQYDFNIVTPLSDLPRQRNHKRHSRRQPYTENYLYDAVGAINMNGNMVGLLHTGDPDNVNDIFVEFDLHQQGKIIHSSVVTDTGAPINAILPFDKDRYYTFTIQESTTPGSFIFIIGTMTMQSTGQVLYTPIMKSMPENLYINFQWAEYDPSKNLIYVLMGNENSPDQLQARFYIFNLPNMTIVNTEIDVSRFTFMSMHLDRQSGKLFAVSPGLSYQTNTQWHLIEVDPFTGKSQQVLLIANFGYFARYYGGSVFNGISPQGVLYHVFRLYDTDADVIAAIDLTKLTVTFSEITNLRNVHNLALVAKF